VLLTTSLGFNWDIQNFLRTLESWVWVQSRRSKSYFLVDYSFMRTAELNTFNFQVENLRLFVWTRVFSGWKSRLFVWTRVFSGWKSPSICLDTCIFRLKISFYLFGHVYFQVDNLRLFVWTRVFSGWKSSSFCLDTCIFRLKIRLFVWTRVF